ncbi:hypothetical protein [Campylobacter geochelonis]|uniref:Highly acidic protein n=1 Tax=Campylobacter geochelonis TaxID=1780362 RepID=A0A128ENL3_9BACT|nr:hypothetical protein [Campylobacter geochelonis]QKF70369.1 hypothetical protein CGEO_0026 [Campylobacter geochelonis]CZE46206.1 Uncharacterised protein [Campylobacter geochelonis]CZE46426.1 Uncharacterised protein [Campylobacter geochelonis]CZE50747.1 Uncharacterised protein [Campylobacter geochelonis]
MSDEFDDEFDIDDFKDLEDDGFDDEYRYSYDDDDYDFDDDDGEEFYEN